MSAEIEKNEIDNINLNFFQRIGASFNNFFTLSRKEQGKKIGNWLINNALIVLLILFVIVVVIINPRFLSLRSIVNIISQASSRLIMALGVAGIIVLTGTDLSAGRVMGLCACICASLLQRPNDGVFTVKMFPNVGTFPLFVPLLIVMIVGGLFGLFNGFFVAKFKLHPFVVTLATQLIVAGIVLWYVGLGTNQGQPIGGLASKYTNFVNGGITIGSQRFPFIILYAALVTVIMWFIWNKTKLGKNMFAVGANPDAATVSGVSVFWTTVFIFTMAGILYGVAGFLESARTGANSASTGINYELDAIAASVIGGVSFMGGIGKIKGVILGVFLLQLINAALIFISVPAQWTTVVTGAVILAACSLDMRKYLVRK